MLQIRSSNPRLIKISIYLYIKPVVKKMIKKTMTTAINEACIGEGNFFGGEMGIFLLLDGILPPSTGFPPNVRFGRRGRLVHTW